jgi:K+-sensing histidine kinase KdpD
MLRTRHALHIELLAGSATSAAALGLRHVLNPALGALEPFAPGVVAVAVTVWFFGWRGAVLTALTVYFAAHYLFVEPRHDWSLTNIYDVSSFVTNLTTSFIRHLDRRASAT